MENGCWEWQGYKFGYGYGGITVMRKPRTVHRTYYQLVKSFIPENMVLDHLCKNPPCFNPDHLEIVTHKENTLRGSGITANNAQKTHCPQGHEYDSKNTLGYKGKVRRICGACNKIRCARRDKERTLEYHAKGLNAKGKPLKRKIDYRFQ